MKITLDYFKKEYLNFREVMCSTKYTVEQKSDALRGLLTVYVNIELKDGDDPDFATNMVDALLSEYDMRIAYEITKGL